MLLLVVDFVLLFHNLKSNLADLMIEICLKKLNEQDGLSLKLLMNLTITKSKHLSWQYLKKRLKTMKLIGKIFINLKEQY